MLRRLLDADQWLAAVTGLAVADRSKPDSELVDVTLGRAGVAADAAIFVGDAVWDVHAAVDARVRCIGVECGDTSAAELRDAGAVEIYQDPHDLAQHWQRSALGRSG